MAPPQEESGRGQRRRLEMQFFSLLPMSEDWGGSGGWLNKGSAFVDDVTSWEEAAGV